MARVLQQNHAAPRLFERHLPPFLTVGRNTDIGLRPVEEAKLDRLAQNSSDLVVDGRFRDLAFLDSWQQSVSIHESRRRHFKIETAVGGRNSVVRGTPIRHENAVESPLFLED